LCSGFLKDWDRGQQEGLNPNKRIARLAERQRALMNIEQNMRQRDTRRQRLKMTNDTYRVLLVEDDPGLLRLLSMRLIAAGYAVTAVESAEQALAQIPQLQPHLIITDLQMRGMDGMTLFNQVHRHNPSLPVLILTAHGTIPEAVKATSRGVFGYLTKPFDSKVLLGHVAQALKLGREIPARQPDAPMTG
jgi:DNA-binding NtrC family response regulator